MNLYAGSLVRWTLFFLFSGVVTAQDIEIVGSMKQPIKLVNRAHATIEEVTLMKVRLSDKAQQMLAARTTKFMKEDIPTRTLVGLQRQIQLGMNQVPVLNQGPHGTCTTFANTAAIDAVLGKGDYISQLCQLQLGFYLENNAYMPSGWNGTYGPIVLNQMSTFGIINKEQQAINGCGGLTEYPLIRCL